MKGRRYTAEQRERIAKSKREAHARIATPNWDELTREEKDKIIADRRVRHVKRNPGRVAEKLYLSKAPATVGNLYEDDPVAMTIDI